jgi:hypothetical protein
MGHQTNTSLNTKYSRFSQQGAALILMVFILTLVVLAYTVKALNGNDLRVKEATITSQALAEAKAALIGWSVNHPNTPGLMPYPDRNADAGGYDGLSDCPGGVTLYSHLIGRLPWKNADYNDCNVLLNGLGKEFLDGSNEPLWYAVSKNLVHIYSPITPDFINPSLIDNPPSAWMTVYDKNGQLVSNRVAAIIFSPGSAISDQDRSGGKADATNYLDAFDLQSGGGTKSNRTYSSADEDFYMGEDGRGVRSDNMVFQQPYYFNDKLVYITIDELMVEIEKRAAGEARQALKKYYSANQYYPYATQLGTTAIYSGELLNTSGTIGLSAGFLPLDYQSCTYNRIISPVSATLNCSQPLFDPTTSGFTRIEYRNSPSNFTTRSSACVINSNNRCYCTGSGTCSNASLTISCSSSGCAANGTGANTGEFRIRGGKLTFRSGGCVHATFPTKASGCTDSSTSRITCNTSNGVVASSADAPFDSFLPSWFKANQWQNYLYYLTAPLHVSCNRTFASKTLTTSASFIAVSAGWAVTGSGIPAGTTVASVINNTTVILSNAASSTGVGSIAFSPNLMTVGNKTNIETMLITAGKTIAPGATPFTQSKGANQTRPSCNEVNNYLDSTENADADTSYDNVNSPRGSLYNDQMFIVSP